MYRVQLFNNYLDPVTWANDHKVQIISIFYDHKIHSYVMYYFENNA